MTRWNDVIDDGDAHEHSRELSARLSVIEQHMATMTDTWMQKFEQQQARIAELEAVVRQGASPAEEPTMPPLSELTKLGLQVFYTPTLTKKDRQGGKSEWSAKLTIHAPTRRKAEPNIAVFRGERFFFQVMERQEPPEHTVAFAESIRDSEDVWAGMLKRNTRRAGSPYMANVFLVLCGHLQDEPQAALSYDGELLEFSRWRPAAGEKAGHALWYAEWNRQPA